MPSVLAVVLRNGATEGGGLCSDDGDDMFWLAPNGVPTLGDWFRAGGYRTFCKGKWHASHAHRDVDDGEGYLLSIDDDGKPQEENIERYLEADLLDVFGFSEWVGPEPHGLGEHNTGTVKDVFTAERTVVTSCASAPAPAHPASDVTRRSVTSRRVAPPGCSRASH